MKGKFFLGGSPQIFKVIHIHHSDGYPTILITQTS